MTSISAARKAVVLFEPVALAVGCWITTIRQMIGMDMGVATRLGSFTHFVVLWAIMMTAMMLPGAIPAALRRARVADGLFDVPLFLMTYLGIWAALGVPIYLMYRPHGYIAAGAIVIAAGVYELTPVKRAFRQRCSNRAPSGLEFGLCCAGPSIGLMLIQIALGIMSIVWMVVITVIIVAQKILPPMPAVDNPLALVIVGFGLLVVLSPSSIPGVLLPM